MRNNLTSNSYDFYSQMSDNSEENTSFEESNSNGIEQFDFYSNVDGNDGTQGQSQIDVEQTIIDKIQPQASAESQENKSFFQKTKDFFKNDDFGKALLYQSKSGGASGTPVLAPKEAKEIGVELATVFAVEAGFAPLMGVAKAATYAPKVIEAFVRLTRAAVTGAATSTTESLAKTGELPTTEQLLENGLEWMAIDLILQGVGQATEVIQIGYDFGKAIGNIAKKEGVSKGDVLTSLWKASKNKIKEKYGKIITSPEDITKRDVEILVNEAKKEAKKSPKSKTTINIEPVQSSKQTPKVPEGPTQKPEGPTQKPEGPSIAPHKMSLKEFHDMHPYMDSTVIADYHRQIVESEKRKQENKSQDVKPKDKTAKIKEDTRGKGQIYHGSPVDNLTPDSGHYSSLNYYGSGFYTTDALDIAEGYASRKGKAKTPTIYEVTEKEKVNFFDMEKPINPKIKSQLEGLKNHDIIEEAISNDPKQTLREIFDEMREAAETADYIQEQFLTVQEVLRNNGFGGLKHVGGLRTNNKPHEVKIYFDPENQITIDKQRKNIASEKKPKIKNEKTLIPEPKQEQIQLPLGKGNTPTSQGTLSRKPETKKPSTPRQPIPSKKEKQPKMGQKQASRRSDILNLLRKAFNDPIRLGKFKQKALGIHKGFAKVTRLLNDNDIETAAHEIGHNLHYTLYGGDAKTDSQLQANTKKALAPYASELDPLGDYEPYTLEGFAEFTRMYVTNPETAKALAPKFYDQFEKDLDMLSPDLRKALLLSREYYDSYLEGTPDSRVLSQMRFKEDDPKFPKIKKYLARVKDIDNFKTNWLDDVYPIKRMVAEAFRIPTSEVENLTDPRNAYLAVRLLKAAMLKGDAYLVHYTFDPKTFEKTGESLDSILSELKDNHDYREFNKFLIMRRVIEKTAQGIDTGFRLEDAKVIYERDKDIYGNLAKRIDKYNDQLLLYAVKSGLLSTEQYKKIKKHNVLYAPMQRVMEETKGTSSGVKKGLQAIKPLHVMKGSKRDVYAPIESIIRNTYAIITNAEKNITGQVFAKLSKMRNTGSFIERVPTPVALKAKISKEDVIKEIQKQLGKSSLSTAENLHSQDLESIVESLAEIMPDFFLRFGAGTYPAGENIITVFVNGKPTYYEVSPAIYDVWKNATTPYIANKLVKILSIPRNLLRKGAILNPKFMQNNFVRDGWGAALFTKYGKTIKDPVGLFLDTVYAPLAMISEAYNKGPLYVKWQIAGGGMSTMQSMNRASVDKHIRELKGKVKKHEILKILSMLSEIMEEANRLAEFNRGLEAQAKTRHGMEMAAFNSRDLSIDYLKMGLLVKAINSISAFFNVTIQGSDKVVRAIADKKTRNNFIARILAAIALPSLILAWLNRNDKEIEEFQEQEKDFNFIFRYGIDYYKLPVPFETGVIAHGLTRRMAKYMMDKDPSAFDGFIGSIADATLPNFLPTFASPFVETAANKNFFTGARLIPRNKEGLASRLQYNDYTSQTSRLLGRAVNYMIGEDTTSKSASPIIIDHFIHSWLGGLGRLMIKISDASLKAVGIGDKIPKPQETLLDRFGLNSFKLRYPRAYTNSIGKFYENYADAKVRNKSIKHEKKMDISTQESQDAAYQRTEKLYNMPTLDRAYKAMQNCQKEINNIMIDPKISPKEKRQLVDQLYLQKISFAQEANKDIKRYQVVQKAR